MPKSMVKRVQITTTTPIEIELDDIDKIKVELKSNNQPVRTSSRQISKRKLADTTDECDDSGKNGKRQCEKAYCNAVTPICFASASERCVGSGYTSRWYHITSGEHYCNECFDYYYRSHRGGNVQYFSWKQLWSSNSRIEASIKAFMYDQILPFWAQCNRADCRKWRQINKNTDISAEFLRKFQCGLNTRKKIANPCNAPEDERVSATKFPGWFEALISSVALFIQSPAGKHLGQYYPDGVGLSPTSVKPMEDKSVINSRLLNEQNDFKNLLSKTYTGCKDFLQPFYQPTEPRRALCMRPDVMEPDEIEQFPQYVEERVIYLGVRNTILALWKENPKVWLTLHTLSHHLICRGLSRIYCIVVADKILNFLTAKAIVNFGLVQPPNGFNISPKNQSVIIIGAGASGLSAARHLHNLGFKVTILEANSERIGGRIWDTNKLGGACVGQGAQIVTGVINNLITVLCEQANFKMRIMGEKCDLYGEDGKKATPEADQRVDFHFNAMLDSVASWRKNQMKDCSLYNKLVEMHGNFSTETGYEFSEEEERLLQFHLSNLEYACGSHLRDVSALNWDQNEQYPQFAGHHTLLPLGYAQVLRLLADKLDVRLSHLVSKIDYSSKNEVIVHTSSGQELRADKVIVTVPLAVLQKQCIKFKPALPEHKLKAMKQLGLGIIEKVGLEFPICFWEDKLKGSDFFGHIPSCPQDKGFFSVFYDLTPATKEPHSYILMTYISGDAVHTLGTKPDEEIVEMCLVVLRKIFNDRAVPTPKNFFVTRWKDDPLAGMSYSYIKTGGSGEAYDAMAESINDQIYFAGEATNRHFPQTVTGAVLSGVREAYKIASHFI